MNMKGISGALLATTFLSSAGMALALDTPRADDDIPSGPIETYSTETGSANTEAGDMSVKGDTALGEGDVSVPAAVEDTPRADDDIPSGPRENLSTQTGSANTEAGDMAVKGGTAFGDDEEGTYGVDVGEEATAIDTPRADENIPSGPNEEFSTQTGSANTEPGSMDVQEGVLNN
ncbi:MAG: hypothetical protein UMU75_02550 [Halomonas sp.]|nr:hypothetical protein [Halomonas sp.]